MQWDGDAGSHAAPHVFGAWEMAHPGQGDLICGIRTVKFCGAHGPCGRGTEVVEAAVRHHIGACFGALERRILDAVAAAAQRLRDGGAAAGREHSLLQVRGADACRLWGMLSAFSVPPQHMAAHLKKTVCYQQPYDPPPQVGSAARTPRRSQLK